ncbi:hypothetical protein [Spongiimicrobium salis]|uniref:hypothetical protein n=1 Tax=Spongiimicrobium salis TaxID=1667022 RepID=UPI00374C8C83
MLKKILWGILFIGLLGGVFVYQKYTVILSPNVPDDLENTIVHIPSHASFKDVVEMLYRKNQNE